MTNTTEVLLTRLPDAVRTCLTARASGDVEQALSTFSPCAEVADDGHTYRGTAAVRSFLSTAGAQFEYTTTLLSTEQLDDAVWVAHHRIEGDFPGGVADLAFRFELSDALITSLRITPVATPPAAARRQEP